ncbi:SIR2 family protein [Gluconacetobacter liquefaciens]|uniref:SIR2 family protein n=1 Tax=Gluconacetobacter liquefaciens TaxID=89584 RepID=UPI001FEBAAF5|nr:SIR2 family protein [Gluconacetobacter liquefaciens]
MKLDWNKGIESARQAISEAMNAKNIAFLLGAGCSSLMREEKELGIATMAPLAWEFCVETLDARAAGFYRDPPVVGAAPAPWRLTKSELDYLDALGIDLAKDYSRNLERLMEVLFAQRFVLRQSENPDLHPYRAVLDGIIKKVQDFLWTRVTQGAFATEGDTTVRDLYERFYKKLVLRDRSLPRPWVFTTNYDHFSELAMDRLGIPYANGFSGVVERRFNPAIFRYALAEQLDVASRKWTAVDAFVYLCKLHGSVTWTEDDHGLFPIKEVWPPESTSQMLIYPTPAKQNSSLGSPYADLFREFQSRIVREQSVLITAGYAFGDEHLNNIIYQALTIPTFRLVIFAAPDTGGEIAKLRALRDPRIWIIGGDGPAEGTRAHYFDMIVEHFMPQRPSDRIDDAVRKVLSDLAPKMDDDKKDVGA